jgi:hypothetical protein
VPIGSQIISRVDEGWIAFQAQPSQQPCMWVLHHRTNVMCLSILSSQSHKFEASLTKESKESGVDCCKRFLQVLCAYRTVGSCQVGRMHGKHHS